ncbi:MAG: hypothetical protein LBR79_04305 [Oscillospiraceae bacterium]|jgi:hypothetical protein|nr:hypothetical protein [Oscillospiraceae bacterium]
MTEKNKIPFRKILINLCKKIAEYGSVILILYLYLNFKEIFTLLGFILVIFFIKLLMFKNISFTNQNNIYLYLDDDLFKNLHSKNVDNEIK